MTVRASVARPAQLTVRPHLALDARLLRGRRAGQLTNAGNRKLAQHFTSKTAEHGTPKAIVDLVVTYFGVVDLDPCSNPGNPNVPAAQHFDRDDDGLSKAWWGRVYMNPPYGREIDAWIEKLVREHEQGVVTEALALLPGRTDTQWFKRLRDYPCCFIEGRLTFLGNHNPAPFPSVVFYLGDDLAKFYRHFSALGDIRPRVECDVSFRE